MPPGFRCGVVSAALTILLLGALTPSVSADNTETRTMRILVDSSDRNGCDGLGHGHQPLRPNARNAEIVSPKPGDTVQLNWDTVIPAVVDRVYIEYGQVRVRVHFTPRYPERCDGKYHSEADIPGTMQVAVRATFRAPKPPVKLYPISREQAYAQARAVARNAYRVDETATGYGVLGCRSRNDRHTRWKCQIQIRRTDSSYNPYRCKAEVSITGVGRHEVRMDRSAFQCWPD